MLKSPVNDLYYSTVLYLQHQIEQHGQGYTNISGARFYKVSDPELPNNTVYASPFKQFVYDDSVAGATIPSGVYINNVFCNKGVSGLKIDYLNGRVILSGGNQYKNLTISGSFAVKDFNIYPSTESDEELIFETKYEINPSYSKALSGIAKDALVVPGIFMVNSNFRNEENSFGGLCDFISNIHMVVISDSKDQLDALGNLIVDQKYSSFPVVDKTPLNFYGDFKSGNYNYINYVNLSGQPLAYIAQADFYKLNNKDFGKRYPDLKIGFADLEIYWLRVPNHRLI